MNRHDTLSLVALLGYIYSFQFFDSTFSALLKDEKCHSEELGIIL